MCSSDLSGCGLIRSILGILELSSEKNHTFITIWKSWFSYEFPLLLYPRVFFTDFALFRRLYGPFWTKPGQFASFRHPNIPLEQSNCTYNQYLKNGPIWVRGVYDCPLHSVVQRDYRKLGSETAE